ncbi:microcystin-dependent protein [Nonlabens dokdonensis]|jgi:microcystin-dependent protein|uniref:Phage Tail Collar n=2 Tax=Nonlabens dokdonensis TaxID=328515 RepID=L7W796_NONDD|nr:tail fiber protein [Nonlabens dokdonensis]AGC76014.1 phage Tail Collar [Nonlabens dokdonensis DSW-6]PZX43686.1 microcystin-dependent protein [Nonlabens dokdonensis]
MNPFLGEIVMFAGNFAPRGWSLCNGQLLAITQYSALFSILGTTYGGDGRTTFALPDFRSRSPIHQGKGPGLTDIRLGERSGNEQISLSLLNLPNHSHTGEIKVSNAAADDDSPGSSASIGSSEIFVEGASTTALSFGSVELGNTGGQQPFPSRNPYIGINYIIAMQGTFPSRN